MRTILKLPVSVVLAASLLSASSAYAASCPAPSKELNAPNGSPLEVDEGNGRNRELYAESHALLVGESSYAPGSGWNRLANIPAELNALGAALQLQGFHVIRHDDLKPSELSTAIECFVKGYGYRRDARILIYFAGHGFTRTDSQVSGERNVGYVLPIDSPPAPDRPNTAAETMFIEKALRLTQFQEWASAMEARHVIMIFDSCFSGSILGHRGPSNETLRPKPLGYVLSVAASSPVRWFLTSGQANQTVPAVSVFNNLLVQALMGLRPEADVNRDGFLTSGELVQFLKGTLPSYNPAQTPDDGKIREAMLDVGDMAFRLPDRQTAEKIVTAVNSSVATSATGSAGGSAAEALYFKATAPPAVTVLAPQDETGLATAVQQLESSDMIIRRSARQTLAKLISTHGSSFVGELIRGLPYGSYRYQLGVAEALAGAPGGWSASDDGTARKIVDSRLASAKDSSLVNALNRAQRNAL